MIDVSNASAPAILETTRLDGWLVDARAIEGRVLVVTQDTFDVPAPAIITIPSPDPQPLDPVLIDPADPMSSLLPVACPPWVGAGGDGTRYVYEDEASYRARLEDAWGSTTIPSFSVTVTDRLLFLTV